MKQMLTVAAGAALLAAAAWLAVALGAGLIDWALPPIPSETPWPTREARLRLSHQGTLRAIRWAEEDLAAALRADAGGTSPLARAKRKAVAEAREVEAAFRARIRAEFGKDPHELAADPDSPMAEPPTPSPRRDVAACADAGGAAGGPPPAGPRLKG